MRTASKIRRRSPPLVLDITMNELTPERRYTSSSHRDHDVLRSTSPPPEARRTMDYTPNRETHKTPKELTLEYSGQGLIVRNDANSNQPHPKFRGSPAPKTAGLCYSYRSSYIPPRIPCTDRPHFSGLVLYCLHDGPAFAFNAVRANIPATESVHWPQLAGPD